MKYARVLDSVVQEVFTPPTGLTLEDCFTPQVAALFEPCPIEVEQNWIKQEDGTFVAPPEPEQQVEPADVVVNSNNTTAGL